MFQTRAMTGQASSDILEIYLNSRTATQYYNNLISDVMFTLPVIEIKKMKRHIYVLKTL